MFKKMIAAALLCAGSAHAQNSWSINLTTSDGPAVLSIYDFNADEIVDAVVVNGSLLSYDALTGLNKTFSAVRQTEAWYEFQVGLANGSIATPSWAKYLVKELYEGQTIFPQPDTPEDCLLRSYHDEIDRINSQPPPVLPANCVTIKIAKECIDGPEDKLRRWSVVNPDGSTIPFYEINEDYEAYDCEGDGFLYIHCVYGIVPNRDTPGGSKYWESTPSGVDKPVNYRVPADDVLQWELNCQGVAECDDELETFNPILKFPSQYDIPGLDSPMFKPFDGLDIPGLQQCFTDGVLPQTQPDLWRFIEDPGQDVDLIFPNGERPMPYTFDPTAPLGLPVFDFSWCESLQEECTRRFIEDILNNE